jgi:hypothetical protein
LPSPFFFFYLLVEPLPVGVSDELELLSAEAAGAAPF